MKEDARKCVLIQCKVSASVAARLEEICDTYGFNSKYNILQYLVTAFLRIADNTGKIQDEDKELAEFARMFEGWENARTRLVTVQSGGAPDMRLHDSVNLFKCGKKGYISKTITMAGDNAVINTNEQKALEIVLKRLFPRLYAKLKEISDLSEENRMERIIEYLVDNFDGDVEYIEEEFHKKDGSNEYGNVPKKKRSASINDKG